MCYEIGGIVDDLVVYKKLEMEYIFVVNVVNMDKDFEWMVKNICGDVFVINVFLEYG